MMMMINEVNNSVAAKERKFKMASGCDFFFSPFSIGDGNSEASDHRDRHAISEPYRAMRRV